MFMLTGRRGVFSTPLACVLSHGSPSAAVRLPRLSPTKSVRSTHRNIADTAASPHSRRIPDGPPPIFPLSRRALGTDMVVSAGLSFLGDIICQKIESSTEFDRRRLFATTVFGGVYVGGWLHVLFRVYPHIVVRAARAFPGLLAPLARPMGAAHGLGCGLLDNVHVGLIYTPSYFYGVGLLSGQSLGEIQNNLSKEWIPSYVFGTGFWVPFMWLNFAIIPPLWRVRAAGLANLFWNVVIDYVAHRNQSEKHLAPE